MKTMYDTFAVALSYPQESYHADLEACQRALDEVRGAEENNPVLMKATEELLLFMSKTEGLTVADYEELYTRTFDINPVSSLEIGWHLYGEAYERGAFLVTMRHLLRQHQVEERCELPDHLAHALQVLGRMEEDEATAFAEERLMPAILKMLDGFAKQDNPYERLLTALRTIIDWKHLQGVANHG